jgi:hypothetical protein
MTAALAMQAAMQRYAEEVRRTQGLTVQMRVGLNAGEVVRAIGNDLHMDYSAVGQTTHLAARMEQLATPGSILLTAATLLTSTMEQAMTRATSGYPALFGYPALCHFSLGRHRLLPYAPWNWGVRTRHRGTRPMRYTFSVRLPRIGILWRPSLMKPTTTRPLP